MAEPPEHRSEIERIREVLRLLDLARDECRRYLAELERAGNGSAPPFFRKR